MHRRCCLLGRACVRGWTSRLFVRLALPQSAESFPVMAHLPCHLPPSIPSYPSLFPPLPSLVSLPSPLLSPQRALASLHVWHGSEMAAEMAARLAALQAVEQRVRRVEEQIEREEEEGREMRRCR